MKLLEINNLSFGYKTNQLIYNKFNLELQKGEIISIVGESGSGKSTLFELITGNIKPINGNIKVSKIASIYQDPYSSFHPSFTIIDQIKDVVENIDELEFLCKHLSLEQYLINKKPHHLSGGQLQRCSILRALLMKPDVLLADEPTSALDNVIALEVMQLLVKFLDRFAILLITHDENLATWCSDKIIRLNKNGTN
ncbi:MAG: ATP-binding cassette domain-containing protein [Campylobacteraceae bacterium]|nr:ATP-binding cassette domain-containing protein [Campylobacteraceae bacterium]MBT3883070.1 ATP-binding cassette domain-containing protein [Campylobacteraceae bacterium]MBT4030730.1 ATP-binding cassette domain-containing protein [Campylobacteraceae bacterium]MBT4178581.1 ATP-binding cassette domain-containing protein [Campylobacteraceae bacterium]MBT4572701.1 ATP-binding cassette domain-containing protein [Campylobacteraceae bacterium]